MGDRVAREAWRDEGKTADDARGTTDDLLIVDFDWVVAFIVLEGLLSLIRFDLLEASSSSLRLLSSIIVSVGTSCTPEAATGTDSDSGRLRLPPVTSAPLSASPNQLVTMFLMAPRNEELCRTSLGACCPSLLNVEDDNEDAIIIIHNKVFDSRSTEGRRKACDQNTTIQICDTCHIAISGQEF
jgi:hypothetical protein